MQSPLPHAKPDTSGQWKEYGDEGILFSMSCCLPSQTYRDCCGRNPCSSHQEHGICIKLRPKALPTRVLLHLRDLYSKKSKTKTKQKKKIQWPVSLSLPAQLNPKPRIVHEGKLTIKTLVWVCEHSRMGWNSLGGTAFLQEAQLFAPVHISEPLFSQPSFQLIQKKGHHHIALRSHSSPVSVLNGVYSLTAGLVEARELLSKIRSCGMKAENLKKQRKRRKWTRLSKEYNISKKICIQTACSRTVFFLAVIWVTLIMKVPLLNGL